MQQQFIKLYNCIKNTNLEFFLWKNLISGLKKRIGGCVEKIPYYTAKENNTIFVSHCDLSIIEPLVSNNPPHKDILDLYLNHRFDLLGSGWISVGYDAEPIGFDNIKYTQRGVPSYSEKKIGKYEPIDWQRDHKSGFRFNVKTNSCDPVIRNVPQGVDIKFPWELSRMQHLPQLALGSIVYAEKRKEYLNEFINTIFDFCDNNPIGYGVNWVCPMEIGIRAVNLLLAYDIFNQLRCIFPKDFDLFFRNELLQHGYYILNHLEKSLSSDKSGNHYLADLCGILFITSFYQNRSTNKWFQFVAREFLRELDKQFFNDGGIYEYSTAYHRLDSEILAYSLAILLRHNVTIDKERQEKISRIYDFLKDSIRPSGDILQIGDNDSGHLLKLQMPGKWVEISDIMDTYLYPPAKAHEDKKVFKESLLNASSALYALGAIIGQHDSQCESSLIRSISKSRFILGHQHIQSNIQNGVNNYFSKSEFETIDIKFRQKTVLDVKIKDALSLKYYPNFGLVIFIAGDFRLYFRAPVNLLDGKRGHNHNDFLHFEYSKDSMNYFSDQGSYIYTASLTKRNLFRGTRAHNVPWHGVEQSPLLSFFKMGTPQRGSVLELKKNYIRTSLSYNQIYHIRSIEITNDKIIILDESTHPFSYKCEENKMQSCGYGVIRTLTKKSESICK